MRYLIFEHLFFFNIRFEKITILSIIMADYTQYKLFLELHIIFP